ncbi:MAG: hypothetical protein CSB21_03760 [Deltaproteobacteria bacterium]|nr:MAG: hypothetical protein CSB21_03760 [Deltaproteobacteria bacterium]
MLFYNYSTIQQTDNGIFLFMDNNIEIPVMTKCTWMKQYGLSEREEAISFAIKWSLVKVSELFVNKKNGDRKISIIFIKDPEDKIRPYIGFA